MSESNINKRTLQEILEHYGVKGMHWGVRSSGSAGSQARVKKVKQRPLLKTKVVTRGGRAQPATKEAVSARTLQRTFRKSGPNALTNKQLQELQTRLNLEQNDHRMAGRKKILGQKWAEDELKKNGSKKIASLAARGA